MPKNEASFDQLECKSDFPAELLFSIKLLVSTTDACPPFPNL
jgi:hypothetical protein